MSFFISALAFVLISYASYLLILLSLPYIHFEPYVDFLETKQLIYHIRPWRYSFYIHVFTSPLVIIAGLFQFSPWLFRKSLRFHRVSGYVYVSVVLLISGPAAFIMSLYANGGYPAQISFVSLSSLWLIFTFIAFWKARKLDFEAHVKWNIRSYALTLSAVTLRFYAYLFDVFRFELGPRETYILLAYLSWIPNLLFAELLIYWKYPRYLLSARN
ncbi:MAG: hypothetical protein A3D92_21555 [Bacteroidetes bacterium RIFCSPHIGHO2_02_FULL_44_7]|nr:MAG: hypothetical protein A3D92_21555 [Bacteroidetes bacterium RIFCSPHIGHO2_02_FULL_44_7]